MLDPLESIRKVIVGVTFCGGGAAVSLFKHSTWKVLMPILVLFHKELVARILVRIRNKVNG